MIITSEKILERNVLRGLSEYERGVCDVVAAVMSYSADCRYRVNCAEIDATPHIQLFWARFYRSIQPLLHR